MCHASPIVWLRELDSNWDICTQTRVLTQLDDQESPQVASALLNYCCYYFTHKILLIYTTTSVSPAELHLRGRPRPLLTLVQAATATRVHKQQNWSTENFTWPECQRKTFSPDGHIFINSFSTSYRSKLATWHYQWSQRYTHLQARVEQGDEPIYCIKKHWSHLLPDKWFWWHEHW